MNHLNWTKTYNLHHKNGAFRIFISSHKNGDFYGAVLHYTGQGSWEKGEDIELQMQLEQFISNNEQDVYHQCISWVDANLSGDYTVEDAGIRTL